MLVITIILAFFKEGGQLFKYEWVDLSLDSVQFGLF